MNLERLRDHIAHLRSQLLVAAARDEEAAGRLHILISAYERLADRLRQPWKAAPAYAIAGRRRPSAAAMGLATALRGCRTVGVTVSQFFRVHDLLFFPLEARPTRWLEVLNDASAMRRALNRSISLDDLGTLEPARDRFWTYAYPDLRREGNRPPVLYFVPFVLSPLPFARGTETMSVFVQELVKESLGRSFDLVSHSSIASSLRLYPSGVGVIRLKISLTFKQDVYVELLARVARDIESLLFVDTTGIRLDVNAVLGELVDRVCDRLFNDRGTHERRWQPPHTVFELHQPRFEPEEHVKELAYLMSLSPREHESYAKLQRRITGKLKSSHWLRDGLLAVVAPRVMLLTHDGNGSTIPRPRPRDLDFMTEAHELMTAACHARNAFLAELEKWTSEGLQDASATMVGADLDYICDVLSSMHRAFQAVAAIRPHLEKTQIGPVSPVARETVSVSIDDEPIRTKRALEAIAAWAFTHRIGRESKVLEIVTLAGSIAEMKIPFYDPSRVIVVSAESGQDVLEDAMLKAMEEVDRLLVEEVVDYQRLDEFVLEVELNRERLLKTKV